MALFNHCRIFKHEEAGEVTVDWVVLIAAIVGLGIAVITSVGAGTHDLARKESLSSRAIIDNNATAAQACVQFKERMTTSEKEQWHC